VIELRVGASALRGWTSVSVVAGLEQVCRDFQFTINGPLADEQGLRVTQPCSVWSDPDEVARGYLETVNDVAGPQELTRAFGGRSRTCDAVDCSALPGSRANMRLVDLFRAIVGEHDVPIVFDAPEASLRIPRHRVTLGDTIHDEIGKLARERGFLVTDDGAGQLLIVRAGAGGRAATDIRMGANVLRRDGAWDVSGRYSVVQVKGQSFSSLEVEADATGSSEDPGVGRHRLLIIKPEKPVDREGALARARHEAITRAGKSVRGAYTLRGWRQTDGTLWRPNQIARVYDEAAGFDGTELLVVSVTYTLDDQGEKASLVLAPQSGFASLAPQKPIGAGVGRWFDGAEAVRDQRAGVLQRGHP